MFALSLSLSLSLSRVYYNFYAFRQACLWMRCRVTKVVYFFTAGWLNLLAKRMGLPNGRCVPYSEAYVTALYYSWCQSYKTFFSSSPE